jgi:hypothetical protein
MTDREFRTWKAYFERWPFDDYSRHGRPAVMLGMLQGEEPEKLRRWLHREEAPMSDAAMRTAGAFGLVPPKGAI